MDGAGAGDTGRRETWAAYGYLSAVGFVLYAIGALTPYLRDALGLSAAEAALHPSALAAGILAAGALADAVERRVGRRRAGVLSAAMMAAGGLAIALGPGPAVTLGGAFAMGAGAGSTLATVNLVLGRPGGALAAVRFARANVWSMLASFTAPVLIAAAASSALGWQVVPLLPPVAVVALEAAGGLAVGVRAVDRAAEPRRLSGAFWVAWLFVVASVSIEFSYVVWGSSVVAARTGVSLDTATALASLFLAGMLIGRVALGAGIVGTARVRWWVEWVLAVTAVGGVIVWLSTSPALSAVGLLLAGLGTSTLYPQGLAIALGRAGGAALAAGARLTLASGVAILAVPLALGAIADGFGVVAGWPIVVVLCGLAAVIRRARRD